MFFSFSLGADVNLGFHDVLSCLFSSLDVAVGVGMCTCFFVTAWLRSVLPVTITAVASFLGVSHGVLFCAVLTPARTRCVGRWLTRLTNQEMDRLRSLQPR